MQEEIYVSFDRDIYRKDYSNFTVTLYHLLDGDGETVKSVRCTGANLPDTKDVTYKFTGEWIEDKKYGISFKVMYTEQSFRCNRKEVVAYFTSPLIKGAGKVIGGRIYDRFGEDVYRVMEETPEKLLEIKGVTRKKYEQIIESFKENKAPTEIFNLLKQYTKPSISLARKIYEKFGNDSLSVIKFHPYRLCWIKDISFKTADHIARNMGVDLSSMERMKEASTAVLVMNELDGHLCMDIQQFGNELAKLTYVRGQDFCHDSATFHKFINDSLWSLVKSGHLSYRKVSENGKEEHFISRSSAMHAESEVAERLGSLIMAPSCNFIIDKLIDKHEKLLGITLDKNQREAIKMVIKEPVSVITGGPGTGKTTIMKIVYNIYHDLYEKNSVLFAAPTGRAARRLSESVGMPAKTLHSALQIRDSESFGLAYEKEDDAEDEGFDYDFVIVDEASFIDIWLMMILLQHMARGQKLLLVGDDDQLQSVGPGAVLRDILESDVIPYERLDRIFRQGLDSEIVVNASQIRRGQTLLAEGKDFLIHDGLSGEKLEEEMLKTYFEEAEKYGPLNVACLCPVKDYAAGVNSMNKKIQAKLNPPAFDKTEMTVGANIYRVGDLVMELKNKTTTNNGDIGEIKCIDTAERCITVHINDDYVDYKGDEILERLTLAYAMTVHKAQGSEYDAVITCLQDVNRKMCKRSIPYTSFTRGKKIVHFFGSKNALDKAILYNDKNDRKTLLKEFLLQSCGDMKFIPA